ncbi:hypothetical protein SUDANB1_05655 [Streptomyces sp. enrichment culture]|uniref:hypothetical protein n=1 Tax=Streptomyces sp. enrichment culture TaxID=1795815 RepID=UPI003F5519FC
MTLFRFPDPDEAAGRWVRAGGARERARRRAKLWLHRRGWVASPTLSFMNVPFGPDRRDLAGEVLRSVGRALAEQEAREERAGDCGRTSPR